MFDWDWTAENSSHLYLSVFPPYLQMKLTMRTLRKTATVTTVGTLTLLNISVYGNRKVTLRLKTTNRTVMRQQCMLNPTCVLLKVLKLYLQGESPLTLLWWGLRVSLRVRSMTVTVLVMLRNTRTGRHRDRLTLSVRSVLW